MTPEACRIRLKLKHNDNSYLKLQWRDGKTLDWLSKVTRSAVVQLPIKAGCAKKGRSVQWKTIMFHTEIKKGTNGVIM